MKGFALSLLALGLVCCIPVLLPAEAATPANGTLTDTHGPVCATPAPAPRPTTRR